MNKTWLIIKREYLTRVRNKTFIISTFLTPLLLVGLIAAVTFITVKSNSKQKIAVADKEGLLKESLQSSESLSFEFLDNADTSLLQKGYDGVLLAPGNGTNTGTDYKIYSGKNLSISVESKLERSIDDAVENKMISDLGQISKSTLDSLKQVARQTRLEPMILNADAEVKASNSGVAFGVGYGAAFLIYITLFLYGAMVMRGVMEEKTNRIAEVVISSVKPRQLMMGKIIGIGAVGVTQFLMWILLILILSNVLGALLPAETLRQVGEANQQMPQAGGGSAALDAIAKTQNMLGTVNWPLIIGCFLFYFVFGYLFYAALFAAVGSAVNEDPQDAQSLMFPITLPIILAIIIMMNAINQPESTLATWSSIIPFFSPIVMMARLPFGVPGTVPYWQLALSMVSLVLGFLATTWLSAKIYRTGILLYGKKVTLKEMWKWAFRKS